MHKLREGNKEKEQAVKPLIIINLQQFLYYSVLHLQYQISGCCTCEKSEAWFDVCVARGRCLAIRKTDAR